MAPGARSLVLPLLVLAAGCATAPPRPAGPAAPAPPVAAPPPPARPAAPAPAPAAPAAGSFTVERGRPGFVIAAPHGTSDGGTDRLGIELARRTGWGAVVARGFSRPGGRRLSVNRPTEGAVAAGADGEAETAEARRVHAAFADHVATAAQGPLRLYVEIHGNGREQSAGRIEIATVGVDRDEAWRLRTLLELARDARLGGRPDVPRLEVLVEPLDVVHYTASMAKRHGVLGRAPRALHIELPRAARTAHHEAWAAVLADFLVQVATLLPAAGR
jgi:hypothetical protein